MRRFDYRAPRFPVDLLVSLTQDDSTQAVLCKEISTAGMKIELSQPVSSGCCGTVDLSFETLRLRLPVWLVRSNPGCDGVQFVYETKEQRDAVALLVSCLSSPQTSVSLALIN